jgi:hypothetical protein
MQLILATNIDLDENEMKNSNPFLIHPKIDENEVVFVT